MKCVCAPIPSLYIITQLLYFMCFKQQRTLIFDNELYTTTKLTTHAFIHTVIQQHQVPLTRAAVTFAMQNRKSRVNSKNYRDN